MLRKKGFAKRLVLSAASGTARVHFTEQKYENPDTPPMFCMLARKIFSSARLIDITQKGLERVIEFTFDTANEMGDRIRPKIVCELIGNSSNIILVGEDDKIYDAVHRSDIEATRLVVSGATYRYPDTQNKINILDCDINNTANKILNHKNDDLSSRLLQTLQGVSPLVCRELANQSGEGSLVDIIKALQKLKKSLSQRDYNMLCKPDGTPVDFCYMPISQYGSLYTVKQLDSPSALLDAFYFERENATRIHKASADLTKLVSNLMTRAARRMAIRQ